MKKKDDKLRETILSVARDFVEQEGIDNLNIRSLAKQSGVASGTVYNYFSSKEEILLALTKDYWKQAILDMDAAITADSFCEGLAQILSYLKEQISQSAGKLMHSLGGVQRAGKESMAYTQLELDAVLLRLLEHDPGIRSEIWKEDFTKKQFVKFVRRNLTGLLKEDEEAAVFFIRLTGRIIYKR